MKLLVPSRGGEVGSSNRVGDCFELSIILVLIFSVASYTKYPSEIGEGGSSQVLTEVFVSRFNVGDSVTQNCAFLSKIEF